MEKHRQRLTELRHLIILQGYQGCGYPSEEWFEMAEARLFIPIDQLDQAACETEINQLQQRLAGT
ncbi:MAG: hypothetical protein AseanaTS_03030 [Candidatus Pelagadaptatus aseana]|uniref:hypothetical protein n=1 Tax=Candidatus Pelagadaptatus aseana TaxID=3120508 RepID=UPI0039B198CD